MAMLFYPFLRCCLQGGRLLSKIPAKVPILMLLVIILNPAVP